MEAINSFVKVVGCVGCLFAASFFMFYTLVNMRFFDFNDGQRVENRWRNDNRAAKLGGIGIFILFVLSMYLFSGKVKEVTDSFVLVNLFLLCSVGFVDDVFNMEWEQRLMFYIVLSALMVVPFNKGYILIFYSFIIFFFINSFNMLDNMDLISILIAIQTFSWVGVISGDYRFVLFAFVLLPFVYFNWLGKLMMGDCGSTVLGAIFGICAVWMLSNGVPWYSVVLIFIVPIADTTFVLTRRLVERRPLWVGGVDHLTHTLARYMGPRVCIGILSIVSFMSGLIAILLK